MKSIVRQIRFLFAGAGDLDRRINETLNHHRELEERIAKFEHNVATLSAEFEDLNGRVVAHLQSMQNESDRFIRMTEIEFEAFRKSLLEAADEILRLSNQMHSD